MCSRAKIQVLGAAYLSGSSGAGDLFPCSFRGWQSSAPCVVGVRAGSLLAVSCRRFSASRGSPTTGAGTLPSSSSRVSGVVICLPLPMIPLGSSYPRISSHPKVLMLTTPAKSLLLHKVTYSQVLRIRAWTALGGHSSATTDREGWMGCCDRSESSEMCGGPGKRGSEPMCSVHSSRGTCERGLDQAPWFLAVTPLLHFGDTPRKEMQNTDRELFI